MTTYLVTICSLSLISLDNLINPGNAYECPKHVTEALWQPPSTDDYRGLVDESIGFQFKDPKTYKGPVVPGWVPGETEIKISVFYQVFVMALMHWVQNGFVV